MDMMFIDYISGEIIEKVANEGIDIYSEDVMKLDVIFQLCNHDDFTRAEIFSNGSLYFEFGNDDEIFVYTDEDMEEEVSDVIGALVGGAWKIVRHKAWFEEVVLKSISKELRDVLNKIY